MAKATEQTLPSTNWVEQVANEIGRLHGIELANLVDRNETLLEWCATGLGPEQIAATLDPFDLVIARWLGRLIASTRVTYRRGLELLARELGLASTRVRSMLHLAAQEPKRFETLIGKYVDLSTTRKPGTVRGRLFALKGALFVLAEAKLLPVSIVVELPPNRGIDLSAPRQEVVAELAGEPAQCEDALGARRRAEFLLAADAIRPHEIRGLELADVHDGCLMITGERVTLSDRAALALKAWLRHRGGTSGPLFVSFDGGRARRFTTARLTTRAIERDIKAVSGGRVTLTTLRRAAVVAAVREGGWSHGERVARFTHISGVKRLVDGAALAELREADLG